MAGEKAVPDRLAALPRRAVVAFAARCARRVQPLTHALPEQDRDAIARAIAVAEAFANGDAWAAGAAWDAAWDAAWAARDAAGAAAGAAARATAWAARAAAWDAAWDAARAARDAAGDARDAARDAAGDAASSDLDRLSALNLGRPDTLGAPIDPSEAGPLGPLWPQGVPGWVRPAGLPERTRSGPPGDRTTAPIDIYFDLAGFGDEEIAEMLGRFSDLYHALSGDVLVIEGTETLDPSRAPTPEGVE